MAGSGNIELTGYFVVTGKENGFTFVWIVQADKR